MKNTFLVPLFFCTLLLIGGGCNPQLSQVQVETNQPVQMEMTPVVLPEPAVQQAESVTTENKIMSPTDAPIPVAPTEKPVPTKKSAYESYNPEKLAFAKTGDVVLFFHAPWCPECKEADTNIKNTIDSTTSNILILKVDFDSSTELKKKYKVTYQHTFVQVDSEGNLIKKWSGSATLDEILKNVE